MMGFQDQQSKRVYIDGHTGPNWAPRVPQSEDLKSNYQVRKNLALFCKWVTLILGQNSVKRFRITNIIQKGPGATFKETKCLQIQ